LNARRWRDGNIFDEAEDGMEIIFDEAEDGMEIIFDEAEDGMKLYAAVM
jgi:hypothetical protein